MAHPLGNFTVNQYTRLDLGQRDVSVRYVLDMAEIPTFQRRHIVDVDGDGRISAAEAASESRRLVAIVAPHLRLVADGRPVRLAVSEQHVRFPRGQGGLSTTRLDARFRAVGLKLDGSSHTLRSPTATRPTASAGASCWSPGTRGSPCGPPTHRCATARARSRTIPTDLLHSPPDVRAETTVAALGSGGLVRAGDPGAGRVRACRGVQLGEERRRLRVADRERRQAERVGRDRRARPRARVRNAPRSHTGARQDDGGGLPRGHPRLGAPCADPRRHGHDHAHRRGVRARASSRSRSRSSSSRTSSTRG